MFARSPRQASASQDPRQICHSIYYFDDRKGVKGLSSCDSGKNGNERHLSGLGKPGIDNAVTNIYRFRRLSPHGLKRLEYPLRMRLVLSNILTPNNHFEGIQQRLTTEDGVDPAPVLG